MLQSTRIKDKAESVRIVREDLFMKKGKVIAILLIVCVVAVGILFVFLKPGEKHLKKLNRQIKQ